METIGAPPAMNYKFPYPQNYTPARWRRTVVSLYGNFRPPPFRSVIVSLLVVAKADSPAALRALGNVSSQTMASLAITAVVPDLAQSEIHEGDERDLVQHIVSFIATQADRLEKIAGGNPPKVDAALS
jgi:hypothetical protein